MKVIKGIFSYKSVNSNHNGITFAGQNRKKALSISRILNGEKKSELKIIKYTYPTNAITQYPTYGALSILYSSCNFFFCLFLLSF